MGKIKDPNHIWRVLLLQLLDHTILEFLEHCTPEADQLLNELHLQNATMP
jgi:hypothetical protein